MDGHTLDGVPSGAMRLDSGRLSNEESMDAKLDSCATAGGEVSHESCSPKGDADFDSKQCTGNTFLGDTWNKSIDAARNIQEANYAHVSDFQVQNEDDSNYVIQDFHYGPPTFGRSCRGTRQDQTDDFAPSGAFNGIHGNYMVFRNVGMDSKNATISFGCDDMQQSARKHQHIIEAVNYYVPEPQRMKANAACVEPAYGQSGIAHSSIVGNRGGDSTTSTHSRYTEYEDYHGTNHNNRDDECYSPIASSTGGRRAPIRMGRMLRNPRRRVPRAGGSTPCSDADSNDAAFSNSPDGLFEVPLNVCSMSRIIDPFKGFTKVHTNRAIRLLHFVRTGNRTVCNLESNACKLLQTRIKDHKVVAVSIWGDSRSGKSYLASLLVNQPVKSFRCSEAYSVGDSIKPIQGIVEGTVWIYVGIYEEEFAYIYLDFDGFENHHQERINMMTFALLLSNCVVCNIANPPRSGIYDAVRAMIDVTKAEHDTIRPDIRSLDMEETIDAFQKKTSFFLNKNASLSKSLSSKNFDLLGEDESDVPSPVEEGEVWKAPIMHFVFRDCDGRVRCIDDRVYTPETLVEQGIFDHYTNILNCNHRDRSMDFKNDMLDAFEIFSHRKYTSLPYPVAATNAMSSATSTAANNAKDALKRIFATLLAPSNMDIMSSDIGESSNGHIVGGNAHENQPNLMGIPSNLLNSQFCERLDDLKACVYQDTLAHAQCDIHLTGRMFVDYLQLLIAHFNMCGRLRLKDAKTILRDVHMKENERIKKDILVQFLKGLKNSVVTRLPMEPRQLLSRCMHLKQKSIQGFQTRAFGRPFQYKEQCESLELSLDGIIEKLEEKNDTIAVDTSTAMFEKCAKSMEGKMSDEAYTYEELLVDIAKMRKLFLQKFKGHSQVTEKVFPQLSQKLYKTFYLYHPKTTTSDISKLAESHAGEG